MIIGIHARKQCGKSSMAKFIKELLPDKKVRDIALAKPLKDFVHQCFGIPKRNLYGSEADKNYPLCTWGEIFTGLAVNQYKKRDRDLLNAREILQLIGTDVMRHGRLDFLTLEKEKEVIWFIEKRFGAGMRPFADMWVNLAAMDIKVLKAQKDLDIGIISDVRFVNEFEMIQKNNGKTVRLYRDTGCEESIVHESERQLEQIPDSKFDFVLFEEKNETLQQLKVFTIKVLMECELLASGGFLA